MKVVKNVCSNCQEDFFSDKYLKLCPKCKRVLNNKLPKDLSLWKLFKK